MSDSRPDDERLSAWLDQALDPAEQAEVQAWLNEHPEDAAMLRLWAADREALRAQAAPLLQEPVPARLRDTALGAPRAPAWRQAAMAAGLLLTGMLLGAGGLWQLQASTGAGPQAAMGGAGRQAAAGGVGQQAAATGAADPQGASAWVRRAAYAHSVYVPEPRHPVEVKAQEEHLARWLTRRIEVPVKLFDLREQGFELIGGRLLPDGAGKSAQLMYQDAQGVRVTVYLRKPEDGASVAFRYAQQGDVGMFYWVEAQAGYALVGALPKATLLALAQAIYKQHPEVVPPR